MIKIEAKTFHVLSWSLFQYNLSAKNIALILIFKELRGLCKSKLLVDGQIKTKVTESLLSSSFGHGVICTNKTFIKVVVWRLSLLLGTMTFWLISRFFQFLFSQTQKSNQLM